MQILFLLVKMAVMGYNHLKLLFFYNSEHIRAFFMAAWRTFRVFGIHFCRVLNPIRIF